MSEVSSFKTYCTRRFGRDLTTDEYIEVLQQQIESVRDDLKAMQTRADELKKQRDDYCMELATIGSVSDLARGIALKIDEILDVPAESYSILVRYTVGEKPTLNYTVNGIKMDE